MSLAALARHRRVYIATPYTKYRLGIQEAWKAAVDVCGRLKHEGVVLYSPIVHSHPIAVMGGIDPLDFKMWIKDNESQVADADAIAVIQLEGWEESYGVKVEIDAFKAAGKSLYLVHPVTLEVTLFTPPPEPLEPTPLELAIARLDADAVAEASNHGCL